MSALLAIIAAAAIGAAPGGSGAVRGKILFEGTAPKPAAIDPQTDREICSAQDLVDESLLVDPASSGIKNVAVWIEKTKGGAKALALDNRGCRFDPHVSIAAKGAELTIKNRDTFLHTAAAKDPKGKDLFNVALPIRDQEAKKTLNALGPLELRCDVHPWMRAFVVVNDGELSAVSDAQGSFEISGVPPGRYTVRVWHETLGEKKVDVEISAGKTASLELKLKR